MHHFALRTLLVVPLLALPLDATLAQPVPGPAPAAAPAAAASAAQPSSGTPAKKLQALEVSARRLDAARNELSPSTGSSIFKFSESTLQALPLGQATPLSQVVLRAPGVVQDGSGQVHVRGDHGNLQYRINGVVIPESVSGFGTALGTAFAHNINVLTGALPAQYGYRTAGVVDITTKGQDIDTGGSVGVTLGSHGDTETTLDAGGAHGPWNGFVSASTLRSALGIENPTPARDALHDVTRQGKAFGYVSRLVGDTGRISLMLGAANNAFEIPNVPGQTPAYTLAGVPAPDSATLDARQRERNNFQIATWQASPSDALDYQVALFRRYSDVHYTPDIAGDLSYRGIAADVLRRNDAQGLQADATWRINPAHTVRAGLFAQHERYGVDNRALVFPADATGAQTSSVPLSVTDLTSASGGLVGVYGQDEWKLSPALTFNYGARYDRTNAVAQEQQLSPRLGLVWSVSASTRVHAGYARYFTPPPTEKIDLTSVALFAGTTNALPSNANTAVLAERSHYFDVGVSHEVDPTLTIGVDAYYRRVRNLQDEGQFGNALIYSAFNYAQGRVAGIELSATWQHAGASAYANLAVSRAEGRNIVTGQYNFSPDELAYIASHWVRLDHDQALSGSAGATVPWAQAQWSADVLWGSGLRRGFANTQHLPGYAQVNLSVTRHVTLGALGALDLRLAIINALDRIYLLRDGSGIGVGAPQYGPRRGVFVGFTRSF